MPTLRYALEPNGPKRLELAWEGAYDQFTIKLDEQEIGRVPDRKALAAGHQFPLPDGSTLMVRAAGTALANELRVLRNGQPLPGSATDPEIRLRNVYQVLYLIGGINVALGLLAGLGVAAVTGLGFTAGSAILGVVYLGLGGRVSGRSRLALALAVLLYGLETLMGVLVPLLSTSGPNVVGLLLRGLVLWYLLQGFGPLRQLREAGLPPAAPGRAEL